MSKEMIAVKRASARKRCKFCEAPLERKLGETPSNFKRRRTCDRSCAMSLRMNRSILR